MLSPIAEDDTIDGMTTHNIIIQPAASVPRQAYVAALNESFKNYFVPLHFSEDAFLMLIEQETIWMESSAAAVDAGRVVGVGMLAVRGKSGWIGGMGVIPEYRRQGLARRMMQFLLEQSKSLDLERVRLEVITQNTGAYTLYQSLGFETARELHILSREVAKLPEAYTTPPTGVSISEENPANLLNIISVLPSAPHPWQRSMVKLKEIALNLKGIAAVGEKGETLGLCLYGGQYSQIGIVDLLAVSPQIGGALLSHLQKTQPEARMSYVNVGEDDPLLSLFKEVGFKTNLSQYEMFYTIGAGTDA